METKDMTIVTNSYTVSPLHPDAPFGAMVSGLTLAHLGSSAVRAELLDLWIDRGVLLFRGEDTPEMHVRLSECFGQLERHVFPETWVEGRSELVKVKYYPDDGSIYEIEGKMRGGWLPWHSDLIYTDTINRGGILRPVQLPASLGMTGLTDQIAAYERLPDTLKAQIQGLHVVYAMDLNSANHKFGRPEQIRFVRGAKSFDKIVRREYEYPRVLHPMVYVQAETGRRILNVSPAFALGIYEIGGPEGDDLLREIIDRCIDRSFAYFHDWQAGDMLLWDNWRTLHCATGVPVDETRVMHRTTISGDYALGRKLDGSAVDLPRVDV